MKVGVWGKNPPWENLCEKHLLETGSHFAPSIKCIKTYQNKSIYHTIRVWFASLEGRIENSVI